MASDNNISQEPTDSQMLPSVSSKACTYRHLMPWNWRPTSTFMLAYAEEIVFHRVHNCELDAKFVKLPGGEEIRTVRATACSDPEYLAKTPLVLLHGMGAGIGLWCKNIDSLAKQRPVYAIDLLGFGRSSRVAFPQDPEACEAAYVQSIEDWRRAEGLGQVILLGHSFGGYLAFNYAVRHPTAVTKLILADPWGLVERPPNHQPSRRWVGFLGNLLHRFDPLAVVRAAGPLGPSLIRRFRSDIQAYFDDGEDAQQKPTAADAEPGKGGVEKLNDILDYIYHCNAQPPSGETGFRRLAAPLGFALRPMFPRLGQLEPRLPVCMIYGGRSWLFRFGRPADAPDLGDEFRQRIGPRPGKVTVHCMAHCNHHLYAENAGMFNHLVSHESSEF